MIYLELDSLEVCHGDYGVVQLFLADSRETLKS
jgi:hypothetical protein